MVKELESVAKEWVVLKLKNFFAQNASLYHSEMVFLYGSWGEGYPRRDSDIDLAVVFSEQIIDKDKVFSSITDISYNLEEELSKEVNVLPVLEDFYYPYLYYNAVVLGKPIFVKDYNRLMDLKLNIISLVEDFKIFGVEWQKEITARLMKIGG